VTPPRGRQLVTLADAPSYILKLKKAEQNSTEWQAAIEALLMAAEGRGPMMHARTGVLKALNGMSNASSILIGKTRIGARAS
jgi:hypothetical protein